MRVHWFTLRANQWPLIRETLFSLVPPCNSLATVLDQWRAFWADTAPFKGPQPQRMHCFRNYGDTRTQSGAHLAHLARRFQDTVKKQPKQTLIVRLLKTPIFIDPKNYGHLASPCPPPGPTTSTHFITMACRDKLSKIYILSLTEFSTTLRNLVFYQSLHTKVLSPHHRISSFWTFVKPLEDMKEP